MISYTCYKLRLFMFLFFFHFQLSLTYKCTIQLIPTYGLSIHITFTINQVLNIHNPYKQYPIPTAALPLNIFLLFLLDVQSVWFTAFYPY